MFKKGVGQTIEFKMIDSLVIPEQPITGDAANITALLSKDDGSFTALTTATVTEVDSTNSAGMYRVTLSSTEANADKLHLVAASSTPNVKMAEEIIIYTNDRTLADGAITASVIADNALTAAKFAAGAFAAVWNYLLTSITTTGSIGKLIKDFLDATISSRATPDDIVDGGPIATDSGVVVAVGVVGNVTDPVALPIGDGVGEISLTAGKVVVGTNDDKDGYTLTDSGLDSVMVAGVALPEAVRRIAATTTGVLAGAGTGTEVFKDFEGTTCVTVTIDDDFNRTNVIYAS